ncbi:MAG: hypothetical protein HY042_05635, partial [Spirochaetia bacterium]|nr:hypothetical protein [Spirochaetia bacterium]
LLGLGIAAPRLFGEDLWKDHDPYSSRASVKAGSIIKLSVDEPVQVEYEYDKNSEENGSIKMAPDKGLTDFLPGAKYRAAFMRKI